MPRWTSCAVIVLVLALSCDATDARRKRRHGPRWFRSPMYPEWPPTSPGSHVTQGSGADPDPLCLRAHPSSPSPLDIWILAGQSNMGGENSNDGEEWPHPLGDPVPGQLLMFPNATGVWRDAEANMCAISSGCAHCTNSMGPGIPFGRTMLTLGLAQRIGFVPVSMGGTSLKFHWAPGLPRYVHMMSTTLQALAAAGPDARLRGMLWVQGEADGGIIGLVGPDAAPQYGANLRAFIAKVREDLTAYHPLLPIVVVKMSTTNRLTAFPFIESIRRQQEEVLGSVDALIAADQQGLTFYSQDLGKDLGGPTDVHLTKMGACQLGVQMAQNYAQWWQNACTHNVDIMWFNRRTESVMAAVVRL